MSIKRPDAGYTLVELMVAMALSLAVVGASLMVFTAHRGAFDRQQAMVEEQQIARFTLDKIADDVRLAGLWVRGSSADTVVVSGDNTGPIGGTDTLTVRYALGMKQATAVSAGATTLTLVDTDFDGSGDPDYDSDDFTDDKTIRLTVSEGPWGELVEEVVAVAIIGTDTYTLLDPVVNNYQTPVVGVVQEVQYSLDYPTDPADVPTLYREVVRYESDGVTEYSAKQQLGNFIDDFQVEFGHLDPYADSVATVGSANVTALRVVLVTRSEEEVHDSDVAPPTAPQNSGRGLVADRYLRRVYEQTIALRN
jgi:prepilin-type N-terminal cleavage/methylation domain-containing protein